MKTNIAILTGLMLIATDGLNAESILTKDQMDRITAGFFVSVSDENAFFKAIATAEGITTADASAQVYFDFGQATALATSSAADSASASASASVTSKPVPQLLSSQNSDVRPSRPSRSRPISRPTGRIPRQYQP